MNVLRLAALGCVIASVIAPTVAAGELRHNPFRAPVDLAGTSGSGAATPTANARPTLIGILLGDDQPLVNLSGEIIGVGEESSGYLLVEVGQEYAVFRRGDETVRMSLDPSDNDE